MQRRHLIFAVTISCVLILGALWFRFFRAETYTAPAGLVAVGDNSAESLNEAITTYLETSSTSTATSSIALTQTDTLSRQLILDYVDLATSGKADDASLQALADKYVDQVPSLAKSQIIPLKDIKTTFNNKKTIQAYANGFARVVIEYHGALKEMSDNQSYAADDETAAKGFKTLGATYDHMVLELKELTVPIAVLPQHLKLINYYSSDAGAVKLLSNTSADPSTAFAGIITWKKNIDEEELVAEAIIKTLTANGAQF